MRNKKDVLQKLKNNKKGFTLVEIIVVLLILAIVSSIAVPTLMGFIDKGRVEEDKSELDILNTATQAYGEYLYVKTDEKKEDIFETIDKDEDRQQILVDKGYIKEFLKPSDSKRDYIWRIEAQMWEVGDEGDTGNDRPPIDPSNPDSYTNVGTILDGLDVRPDQIKGEWNRQNGRNYEVGDLVTKVIDGKIYTFKFMGPKPQGGTEPGEQGKKYWKKIQLDYDKTTTYSAGDIIRDPISGKYYRGVSTEPFDYTTYYQTGGTGSALDQKHLFEEVFQSIDETWSTAKP